MKLVLTFLTCFLITFTANAKENTSSEYTKNVADKIFAIITNKSLTLEKQKSIILRDFISEIDFEWNSRAVCGRNWKSMNEQQQKDFVKYYQDFLVRTWLPKFKGYNNEKFSVKKQIPLDGTKSDTIVPIIITTQNNTNITVELRVREFDDKYKILNIKAEGIDMAMVYNTQFGEYVEKYGIDELIKYLKTGESKK